MQYYYGDGKGKTTAAIGSAIRMAGTGKKVIVCQFFKNGDSNEVKILKSIPNITYVDNKIKYNMILRRLTDEDKLYLKNVAKSYVETLEEVMRMAGKDPEVKMVILDEFDYLYKLSKGNKELLSKLHECIIGLDGNCELIITAHEAIPKLVDWSIYVTEFKKIKHPYDYGKKAREGVEY